MKILVTGGAGYVGTRLSNFLYREGHKVTIFDNLTYGVQGLYPGIKIIKGDISKKDDAFRGIANQEVIFHLAAISNDPTGNLNPELTERVNFEGTLHALDAARIFGVKRFIFASSSSVLGIQEGSNTTETAKPNPLTPYSKTKLAAEQEVLAANTSSFTTCALRPATICGVSPRQRFDLVVNALTGSAFFDKHITVYGGTQRRPNLTMTDMLRAYTKVFTADPELIGGEVFHVGWENMKILDIAKRVVEIFKDLEQSSVSITVKESVTDMRDYHITSDKITNVLNFEPSSSFEDAIYMLFWAMDKGFITDYTDPKYHNVKVLTQNENSVVSR